MSDLIIGASIGFGFERAWELANWIRAYHQRSTSRAWARNICDRIAIDQPDLLTKSEAERLSEWLKNARLAATNRDSIDVSSTVHGITQAVYGDVMTASVRKGARLCAELLAYLMRGADADVVQQLTESIKKFSRPEESMVLLASILDLEADLADGMAATLDQLAELRNELATPIALARAPMILRRAATRPPTFLLAPAYGVVPYLDVDGHLMALTSWATTGPPFSVQFVQGAGGSGKSRVALELCKNLDKTGWITGVLRPDADAAALARLGSLHANRLVVVDYAESTPDLARAAIRALRTATRTNRGRILLLVRSPAAGPQDLRAMFRGSLGFDGVDEALDDAARSAIWADRTYWPVQERRIYYRRAIRAFAAIRHTHVPEAEPNLHLAMYNSPLAMSLDALNAVTATECDQELAASGSVDDLLNNLMVHELAFWEKVGRVVTPGHFDASRLADCASLLHMSGPRSESAAADLLQCHVELAEEAEGDRRRTVRLLRSLSSDKARFTIVPDRLGEYMLARCLTEGRVTAQLWSSLAPGDLARALPMLSRLLADRPEMSGVIGDIVCDNLAGFVRCLAAKDVSPAISAPAARAAERLLATCPTLVVPDDLIVETVDAGVGPVRGLALAVLERLISESTSGLDATVSSAAAHRLAGLCDVAVHACILGREFRRGQTFAERAVSMHRLLLDACGKSHEGALAVALDRLGGCLVQEAALVEALQALRESIDRFERLREQYGDRYSHGEASARHNLAVALRVGGSEIAEAMQMARRAVELLEVLSKSGGEDVIENLSKAYQTLAMCAFELDLHDQGEEHLALATDLARSNAARTTGSLRHNHLVGTLTSAAEIL